MSGTRVVVLGAGPAGLGAALGLARRGFQVELLERQAQVGGNAGSFELAGLPVDFGSHRLHPASDPEILALLRGLLGDDLRVRPRHGRIRLLGRWIHFPLRPLDLALRMHPRFAAGVGVDLLRKLAPGRSVGPDAASETFASVLARGLGPTICREFYFPYARKIWGLPPEDLSAIQARRRVSSGTIGSMLRRLLPGGAGSGGARTRGVFYYPRRGFGQISTRLREAAEAAGARVHLGASVERIACREGGGFRLEVGPASPSSDAPPQIEAERVWSTIPATALTRLLEPAPPAPVRAAADALQLRGMLLIYLVLETDRFTEYDAHYFPEAEVPFTRLSEPKNYADVSEPRGRTVLCAELPANPDEPVWSLSDEALGELVREGLGRAGLPVRCPVSQVVTRRLPAAYPTYRVGYEEHFGVVDAWLDGIEGLLSFGRQGLFAHDNTHHTLAMAHAAVSCLGDDGGFDAAAWARHRQVFETFVVED